MKLLKLNNKAFSLIELMVVVAIIGLLAAIGIPQYSKFQAKARQSEAKTSLSAAFTAQTSFFSEWNQYSIDLRNIGFGVAGSNLRYITGLAAVACTGYVTTAGAPGETVNVTNTWSNGANVNVGTTAATWAPAFAASVPTAAHEAAPTTTTANSNCDSTPGAQTFKVVSGGDPNNNFGAAATRDVWAINHQKVISNPVPGIQ